MLKLCLVIIRTFRSSKINLIYQSEQCVLCTFFIAGVEKLFNHLHQNNIPFAIATASTSELYNLKVQKYEKLFSLVDHITMAGSDPDVKHGKPAPDVLLVCAERFNDRPNPNKVRIAY